MKHIFFLASEGVKSVRERTKSKILAYPELPSIRIVSSEKSMFG